MTITPSAAAGLHTAQRDRLPMWTVTRGGTECPELYVARLHYALPKHEATAHTLSGSTIHEVRRMIPPGLYCLERHPSDDPVILETWL